MVLCIVYRGRGTDETVFDYVVGDMPMVNPEKPPFTPSVLSSLRDEFATIVGR